MATLSLIRFLILSFSWLKSLVCFSDCFEVIKERDVCFNKTLLIYAVCLFRKAVWFAALKVASSLLPSLGNLL